MEPLLLEIPEGCEITRLGRSKFLELVYSGQVPSIKVGTRRLILAEGLRRWIQAQATGSNAEQSAAAEDRV